MKNSLVSKWLPIVLVILLLFCFYSARMRSIFLQNLGMVTLTSALTSHLSEPTLETARTRFLKASSLLPVNQRVRLWLGYTYLVEGKVAEAIVTWQNIKNMAVTYLIGRGDMFAEQNAYQQAIDFYRVAQRIVPQSSQTYVKIGRLQRKRGNLLGAAVAYQQALQLDVFVFPAEKAVATYEMAEILYQESEWRNATEYLKIAIKLNPYLTSAHLLLGNIHFQFERYSDAYNSYQQAIIQDPKQFEAQYKMGLTCLTLKKMEEAVMHLETAVQLYHPDPWVYLAMGDAYWNAGQRENAIHYYKQVVDLAPDSAPAGVAEKYLNTIGSNY